MATFLDVSILSQFSGIFTFLLVFVIVYGMLEVFKIFGDGRRGLHAIIALAIGMIVMFSTGVVSVIQTFMPWFTLLIIVIFFILFAVRMFGSTTGDILGAFKNNSSILTWILILTGVILLFSLGAGFGQQSLNQNSGPSANTTQTTVDGKQLATGSTDTGNFNQNLYNTLYHPKVLGLILVMIIVILAMLFLTTSPA